MKRISDKNSIDSEINELLRKYNNIGVDSNQFKNFTDFPLSRKTLRGLSHSNYTEPTLIQRESINLALQGIDVVGCATTGSGKTLAFLIPVLERLYVKKWSTIDGVGAIIISPTRELAYQIFETLKKVGKYHEFSAGLIIGGKNLKFEKKRMDRCNILICTPGRLMQHMDENPLFNGLNLQILVLDEADRCLDMGFEKVINAIIENLQPERQTLLFSATQTQSVKDLLRLNLNNSVYVGPKDLDQVVPNLLQQSYVVVALEDKITMLWSFMKNHLKQKCIVFLASCKQVKYFYEIFCKLRPATSLLALYGTLHQDRRIAIYNDFVNKKNVFLFATDIASRGLDFPSINWVIQLDCPENVQQYIHRAGRSARNKERGESLLVLMATEEHAMIDELKKNSINIKLIHIDSKKLFSPSSKIEAFLAQNPNLKASAKRAFTGYIKSVYHMKNKKIFDVRKINFDGFAKSLGLVITPKIRFISNKLKQILEKDRFGIEDMQCNFDYNQEAVGSSSDEIFTIKKNDNADEKFEEFDNLEINLKSAKQFTKAAQAKKLLKKQWIKKTIKYNEDGIAFDDSKDDVFQHGSRIVPALSNDISDIGGINIVTSKDLKNNEEKFQKQQNKKKRKITNVCKYDEILSGSNADENPKKLGKFERKSGALKQSLEDKQQYLKRRKVSKKLSLEDAEAIVSEILI